MENITVIENSTLLTTNLSLGNTTEANSTIHDDIKLEDFTTFEITVALFNFLMYILSFVSVIIHLFKFFNSGQKQNLQIKNLTNYCACLLLVYLSLFVFIITDIFDDFPRLYRFVDLYLHLVECIFLLIMSFYTCMCIMVCQKAYHIPLSDERQFLIYSMTGWIFSLLLATVIFVFESSHQPKVIIIMLFRLIAAIPFFVSLWYIKSIGWNRTNIIRNFIIHLRLLILTGVISIIPNTIYGTLLLLDKYASLTKIFGHIADVFYYPEGFIVGLCFTFRKGTFENKIENPIEMTNGYVTEVGQVDDDEEES